MPINVDNSPRSLRGGVPPGGNPPPIQLNAPPPGLGRSGSPANGPTTPATAASLIRTPYSNYAVASAVPQTNHKGIAPSQGAPTDHVRYYQGVAAAAANNLNPAVASIGQNYSTTRVDPSATVFVRNAVRIAAFYIYLFYLLIIYAKENVTFLETFIFIPCNRLDIALDSIISLIFKLIIETGLSLEIRLN